MLCYSQPCIYQHSTTCPLRMGLFCNAKWAYLNITGLMCLCVNSPLTLRYLTLDLSNHFKSSKLIFFKSTTYAKLPIVCSSAYKLILPLSCRKHMRESKSKQGSLHQPFMLFLFSTNALRCRTHIPNKWSFLFRFR